VVNDNRQVNDALNQLFDPEVCAGQKVGKGRS